MPQLTFLFTLSGKKLQVLLHVFRGLAAQALALASYIKSGLII